MWISCVIVCKDNGYSIVSLDAVALTEQLKGILQPVEQLTTS